ncbi:hypothetical protein YC2023_088524 [Brassica napus]
MSKLSCFKVEPVSDHHMEKCGRWYEKYRKEMIQAMGNKDESANEVIQRYKQASSSMNEFYGAAGLEELYPQALALYNIVYDHAVKMNNARNCGFVWKVAGPVLCRFYLEKTEEKSLVCPLGVFKKMFLVPYFTNDFCLNHNGKTILTWYHNQRHKLDRWHTQKKNTE